MRRAQRPSAATHGRRPAARWDRSRLVRDTIRLDAFARYDHGQRDRPRQPGRADRNADLPMMSAPAGSQLLGPPDARSAEPWRALVLCATRRPALPRARPRRGATGHRVDRPPIHADPIRALGDTLTLSAIARDRLGVDRARRRARVLGCRFGGRVSQLAANCGRSLRGKRRSSLQTARVGLSHCRRARGTASRPAPGSPSDRSRSTLWGPIPVAFSVWDRLGSPIVKPPRPNARPTRLSSRFLRMGWRLAGRRFGPLDRPSHRWPRRHGAGDGGAARDAIVMNRDTLTFESLRVLVQGCS